MLFFKICKFYHPVMESNKHYLRLADLRGC